MLGNDFVLPDGKNSVDVLRAPFLASADDFHDEASTQTQSGTSFFNINQKLFSRKSSNMTATKLEFWTKKFNSVQMASHDFQKTWQDRLVIVAEKRIFIVTTKVFNKSDDATGDPRRADLEIVDSIPMEEILSINLESDTSDGGIWEVETKPKPTSLAEKLIHCTFSLISSIKRTYRARPDDDEAAEEGRKAEQEATERSLRQSFHFLQSSSSSSMGKGEGGPRAAHEDYCEPVLRIETAPEGFNRGHTYYFLLRKQDHRTVDGGGGVMPLRNRTDAEALTGRLSALVARRRGEHARETRFLRLQESRERDVSVI